MGSETKSAELRREAEEDRRIARMLCILSSAAREAMDIDGLADLLRKGGKSWEGSADRRDTEAKRLEAEREKAATPPPMTIQEIGRITSSADGAQYVLEFMGTGKPIRSRHINWSPGSGPDASISSPLTFEAAVNDACAAYGQPVGDWSLRLSEAAEAVLRSAAPPPEDWQVGDELECDVDSDEPPVRGLLVAQDSEGYSVRVDDGKLNYFDRYLTTWRARPPLVEGQVVRMRGYKIGEVVRAVGGGRYRIDVIGDSSVWTHSREDLTPLTLPAVEEKP